jgi:5'(3')-deoxyribonucleotidase/uncharacterized protein with PQ loop repeat
MTLGNWSTIIGTVAALCTTLSFLPQLLKLKKQGTNGLSSGMLASYLAGLSLWLVYGLLIGAVPVIAANAVSIVLVGAVAVRKLMLDRQGSGRRRIRIAIDMDEVMADALAEHVRRYNAAFATSVSVADLRGGHLEDYIPAAHLEAAEAMLDSSFFENLELFPDCQEVVRELTLRHDVYIVTAAMDVPCSFAAKYRWLQRHFPFIPASRIVFCGDKGIVDADYLIDDRSRHFATFKGQGVLFSAPHNHGLSGYTRVGSWAEVRELFARLEPEPRSTGGAFDKRETATA